MVRPPTLNITKSHVPQTRKRSIVQHECTKNMLTKITKFQKTTSHNYRREYDPRHASKAHKIYYTPVLSMVEIFGGT